MKAIRNMWRAMSFKTRVSVSIIALSILILSILWTTRKPPPLPSGMIPERMARQLKNGGQMVTLTAIVRGFAWEKTDWTPAWNQYRYGVSRTAYIDYAIDVSKLNSDDFSIRSEGDGREKLIIKLPKPKICPETLIPPTEDKPIEFEHGLVYRTPTKDKVRNRVLHHAEEAIANLVKENDEELTNRATTFAEQTITALYDSKGVDVEIKWE